MAKKKGPRMIIGLVCQQCRSFNYITERNKANTPEKLQLKKYCRKCKKHTLHQERQKLK